MSWVAFYSDCTHRVLPLASGVRVALVYNLVREGAPATPPENTAATRELARELAAWPPHGPVKLAWVLEHLYSQAELSWDRLKGRDQARAWVLRDTAQAAGVAVHLAQLSVQRTWAAWVRHERLDLTTHVERTGSPYGLVCIKTNSRHERAASRYWDHHDALLALSGDQTGGARGH